MENMKRIEKRIEKLERRSRRYQAITAVLVMVIAAGVFMGGKKHQKHGDRDTIKTKRIEIVDDMGKTRILLAVDDLTLGGESVAKKIPIIVTYNADGKARYAVITDEREVGTVLMGDEETPRAGLLVRKDKSIFALIDERGRPRVELTSYEDISKLRIYDEQHNPRFILGSAKDITELSVMDGNNKGRMRLLAQSDSTIFGLMDNNGKVIFQVPEEINDNKDKNDENNKKGKNFKKGKKGM